MEKIICPVHNKPFFTADPERMKDKLPCCNQSDLAEAVLRRIQSEAEGIRGDLDFAYGIKDKTMVTNIIIQAMLRGARIGVNAEKEIVEAKEREAVPAYELYTAHLLTEAAGKAGAV